MKEDCIYWPTGCGQPIKKKKHLMRSPTDFYHPSFCFCCHDYQPKEKEPVIHVIKEREVIVRHVPVNVYRKQKKDSL